VDLERMLADVVRWAERDENIRLVVVTGSYERFGEVLGVEELENPGWNPTRLVYYVAGKIDFMIGSLAVLEGGVSHDRAHCVLVDKDGSADHLSIETTPAPPPPRTSAGVSAGSRPRR
jgi:hypothetical protein